MPRNGSLSRNKRVYNCLVWKTAFEFVVFTREKLWLVDDEGASRSHDGVYYHALGADHVNKSNYNEEPRRGLGMGAERSRSGRGLAGAATAPRVIRAPQG